jgi:hypothetical protein
MTPYANYKERGLAVTYKLGEGGVTYLSGSASAKSDNEQALLIMTPSLPNSADHVVSQTAEVHKKLVLGR